MEKSLDTEHKFEKMVGLRLNEVLLSHCNNRVIELNNKYAGEFDFTVQSYIRRLIFEDMRK